MARLEDLIRGSQIRGILPDGPVTVVDVTWYGTAVVELTYKDATGKLGSELIYRDREPSLSVATAGQPWAFDADGAMLRLVSEAYRIRLAHLFDPLLAVHTSLVDPLPHQITAVYGEMLPRQPLRFLLADDPGAGKTIMTGLLIKELLLRGDLRRCLIVCPGSLVEQWQDELSRRFGLPFTILTREGIEAARNGNPFADTNLLICRLDHLSRNEELQAKLATTDWDLVVCDEAHKLAASFFGGEVKYTKRYHLGQLLADHTRNFLLLTATPHNGKEADFQLFMALIDPDRFEGKYRPEVHTADAGDLMRRLVKEQLVKFDGTPLFPERFAYTVNYELSAPEHALYSRVTDYVRQEFNRADALENGSRKGTVGFALTILQRRLASSPEAIYQSLHRRRERLQARLREEQAAEPGGTAPIDPLSTLPTPDWTEGDLEDAPDAEREAVEEQVVDQASAARTIGELQIEITLLTQLEALAQRVRVSGTDKKWDELSRLLQEQAEMFDAGGGRRKLVIFTEHRDTLNYLAERIRTLLGQPEAVVTIHGGLGRDERQRAQAAFTQDPAVGVLVATDAAGEGINLQRAHLMVNYDLPWNPNRLEQRFGRIHRIGQTEVCHLWNLVAAETREGAVYTTLLKKMEAERAALGGGVFDVLGRAIDGAALRELLIEAIRYGDRPDVRQRLTAVVEGKLDRAYLRQLLDERALARDSMDLGQVQQIRADMERAAARRLQPHFIAAWFLAAFRGLGGTVRERETGRYEVTHVPAAIRTHRRQWGTGAAVLATYERIAFDKGLLQPAGKPPAALVCPGHPLLDATLDLVLDQHSDLLKRGAVLVDRADPGVEPRVLFYLEHAIQDASSDGAGNRRIVSQRMQFVEGTLVPDAAGARITAFRPAGYAPYLDYDPLTAAEQALVEPALAGGNWRPATPEADARAYAIAHLVPEHFAEVQQRRTAWIAQTRVAVHERLTKEIIYWDQRAAALKDQELAGKPNARLNSGQARRRADELQVRLTRRMAELESEERLAPRPPVVIGGALILPAGLLAQWQPASVVPAEWAADAAARARVEGLAMAAVLAAEQALGYVPRDVSAAKIGYDIESAVPGSGRLRFIEVKGRVAGAPTVTVTKNEILTALNRPAEFILALVAVADDRAAPPRYLRRPFGKEPDFGATSVNYDLPDLLARATEPV